LLSLEISIFEIALLPHLLRYLQFQYKTVQFLYDF
jgi:hypothetical protein